MKHRQYVVLSFLVAAVLLGFAVERATTSGLAWQGIPDVQVGLTYSGWAGLVSGIATFAGLIRTPRAVKFTDEVIGELAKVTWPTREETLRATTTVIFTTVFLAVLIGAYDILWKSVARLVLFTEG